MYKNSDIERVERIVSLIDEGHSLPRVADLLHTPSGNPSTTTDDGDRDIWARHRQSVLQAIQEFSTERIESLYQELTALYPSDIVIERLIAPVLVDLGNSWEQQATGIAQEHFFSSWLRNRIAAQFHHAQSQATGPRIIVGCMPGAHHEIGLMLFSLAALQRGYRVLYLGPDMVIDQLTDVARISSAKAIVLASQQLPDDHAISALNNLINSTNNPVMLGGAGSDTPLPIFDNAGGIRLGSNLGIGLRVLSTHLPISGSGTHLSSIDSGVE